MKIERDIRFAWTQADGTLVISQVGEAAMVSDNDGECIAVAVEVMKKKGVMPQDAVAIPIHRDSIPSDRTYRSAWCIGSDGTITVDPVKRAAIDKDDKRGRGHG